MIKRVLASLLSLISTICLSQGSTSALQRDEIAAIKSNSTIIISPSAYTITASSSSVTTSGTITAGARGILLETSSDFIGTINNLLFQPNGFLSLPISPGASWPAIPYTVTSGTLYIRKFN